MRLASVLTVKVPYCFTAPVLSSGNALLRNGFQSRLSKLMNNNYCSKSDYAKTSAAKKALVRRQQATATSVVVAQPVEQSILTSTSVIPPVPFAPCHQARVPVQQAQGRLVSG